MSSGPINRRSLLKTIGALALAAPVLQACGATSSGGTNAESAGGSGNQSPGQATAAPAGQASSSVPRISMSVAVWSDPIRTWQKKFVQEWSQQNPNVNLGIDEVAYADMSQKQDAELASGTLPDLSFAGIKWLYYLIYKGAFLPIDDYVNSQDPGIADFIPVALRSGFFEGKRYSLPSEVNTGNQNIIIYNKDLLAAKGVTPPTDHWQQTDFADLAAKLTDPSQKIFGTDYFPSTTYYDFGALLRSNGVEILSDDGKSFLFNQPISVGQAQWATELRTKYHVAPSRAEMSTVSFPAGQVALHADGLQAIVGLAQAIGDKFKWDCVLGPTSTSGRRGFDSFALFWGISSKTRVPAQAYDLMTFLTSPDVQAWSFANQGQPPSRKSLWLSDTATKINPVWGRALSWISNGEDQGPFPIPWNLRYTELENTWEKTSYPIFYGEAPLTDGIKQIQDACQAIMDKPRP